LYKKTLAIIVSLFVCTSLIILGMTILVQQDRAESVQKENPKFIFASWDYPDEYGQGIDGFRFYENSTGSWVAAPYYTDLGEFYYLPDYLDDYTLNWTPGIAMKLRVFTVLNTTLVGLGDGDYAGGKNYQKHNIIVIGLSTVVFEQQNFTYYTYEWVTGDLIFYEYDVVLNFLPQMGAVYTLTVTYEVFW
jgi:hypothetical protein